MGDPLEAFLHTCCTTQTHLASQSPDAVSEVAGGSAAAGSLLGTTERHTLSTAHGCGLRVGSLTSVNTEDNHNYRLQITHTVVVNVLLMTESSRKE